MELRELVNTCQNQFKNLMEYNEYFEIIIYFEIRTNDKETYKMNYRYFEDEKYLIDYRHRKVNYWEIRNNNTLLVEIEGKIS